MIPAKTLLDGLKDIPEQPISIELNEGKHAGGKRYYSVRCTYAAMRGKFEMLADDGAEFPALSVHPDDANNHFSITRADLTYGIRQVQSCVANDELRPVMNGIYVDKRPDQISFVATNGSLLGVVDMPVNNPVQLSFILPTKFAKLLVGSIPQECNDVDVQVANSNVQFTFGEYTLACRHLEYRYPNYRAVIPKNNNKKAIANCAELLSGLKRMVVFAELLYSTVVVNIGADGILLSGCDAAVSRSAEEALRTPYCLCN